MRTQRGRQLVVNGIVCYICLSWARLRGSWREMLQFECVSLDVGIKEVIIYNYLIKQNPYHSTKQKYLCMFLNLPVGLYFLILCVCVCVCVRACVRACVHARLRVCVCQSAQPFRSFSLICARVSSAFRRCTH